MKTSLFVLIVAAGLSGPAFAQQPAPDHNAHHPGTSAQTMPQPETPAATPRSGMPGQSSAMPGGMMGGMMGQGGQRPGMMPGMGSRMMEQCMANCPMMQGGMGRMMDQGAGAAAGSMSMGQPRGDQGVASLAMRAVNDRMHREMALDFTGNVDRDFVRNMIVHHQAAIDTARIEIAFGKDAKIRELAEAVIKAQEGEIASMKAWLAANPAQ